VVQRSVFDDKVFCDRQVGTCGDGPADLRLSQASAGAEHGQAPRRDGKASPAQQRNGLPDAIGYRGGGGNDRSHEVKYALWLRGFSGCGMIEGGR
jgi:hypothetical protein